MAIVELFTMIKNKWYVVLIAAIVCAAATAAYCWNVLEDEYTSTASLYILSKTGEGANEQALTQSDMNASQQIANDIAVLASSDKVKKNTARALGMESLEGYKIEVKSASTNRVISLSVTGQDPKASALIANELGRQLSATATEIMELKAVNVVDEASIPDSPSGPKRVQYTVVAAIVGAILAMMVIIARELFNVTFRSSEDVEEALGLPVIGRLPKVKQ